MRTNLGLADLGDLLDLPIIAVLATNRADGTVMLSPVWFEWDGEAVVVWTSGPNEGKVRHLARDPRATVVIAEQDRPYRGLEVTGRAELTSDGFDAAIRRISARYVGPEAADGLADGALEPGILVRVIPDRLRAWDFLDDWGSPPSASAGSSTSASAG
ncbi:MAG TPA: TIGR03618 family F420-dependent PPOX class oxidoreductase [Candidatus Limnocylindrales bacterium]|jgi:PPOX class probable F420-dependent enzyme|nr:TIGR03618 family F420-dependent PPOX class oxidoreductase [Candidatus Limnocylindrales bacterium]